MGKQKRSSRERVGKERNVRLGRRQGVVQDALGKRSNS